jgi:hypothetical protein
MEPATLLVDPCPLGETVHMHVHMAETAPYWRSTISYLDSADGNKHASEWTNRIPIHIHGIKHVFNQIHDHVARGQDAVRIRNSI